MGAEKWRTAKSSFIVAGVLLLVIAAAYFAVIPTVVARHYLSGFEQDLASIDASLKGVASTTNLPAFNDPDISLPARQQHLGEAIASVRDAQGKLKNFSESNRLTTLPGTGFAGDYHTAAVRQERAQNAVHQSGQVLAEYAGLLQYLGTYTSLQAKLDNHLDDINNIQNFDSLKGEGGSMARLASQIRGDEKVLQALMPPPEFAALQGEASQSFGQAANGFDALAQALDKGADPEIYRAVNQLESTAIKGQVDDKNLLVSLTDTSPTFRQVAELPEKAEYVRKR